MVRSLLTLTACRVAIDTHHRFWTVLGRRFTLCSCRRLWSRCRLGLLLPADRPSVLGLSWRQWTGRVSMAGLTRPALLEQGTRSCL